MGRLALLFSMALLLLAGCGSSSVTDDPSAKTIYVLSPHGAPIRKEFAAAFAAWHKAAYGIPVRIEWPDRGGTESIKKYLADQYSKNDNCGYDVVFGGGSGTFDDLRDRHFLQPPQIPAKVLDAVPHTIKGVVTRAQDDQWIAATMSNFGIVLNLDRQGEQGLPRPETWADLSGPQWFGQVSVADPSKSGSVRTCYELLLQQYGWEKGWPILVRIFANAEAIRSGGSDPADEVGSANATAGIVIDFFGAIQSAKQGKNLVTFIAPTGGTSLDPDPIAVLKNPRSPDLANHFVEFVVSPPGQKLWVFKPGTPGGPISNILGRKSVLESIYHDFPDYLSSAENPFAGASPLKVDRKLQADRSVFIGDLIRVTLIDNHELLKQARRAVLAAGDRPELLAMFDQLPVLQSGKEIVPLSSALIHDTAKAYKSGQDAQVDMRGFWGKEYRRHLEDIVTAAEKR